MMIRRRARESLLDFTLYTNPAFEANWHHRLWCRYLDDFAMGKIRRLMVFSPPRHGKSELVSRRLPAYILGRNPNTHIIATSYSADLAGQMNRDVQRIIDDEAYAQLFPDTKLYGKNIRTMARGTYMRNSDLFEVVGYQGRYRSAGIGGGIMGMGFNVGLIDDPIKSAMEAHSPTIRQNIWDWYCGTFYNRQMKNAGILIVLTRWHDDDLAGRLLKAAAEDPKADQWTVLRFPALSEPGEELHPEDPRGANEALWPAWYGLDFLEKQRAQGATTWSALYQQRPQLREGGLFKRAWFTEVVDAAPIEARRVRYWDRAATENAGCFTCGVLMAITSEGLIYIEHVVRGQWSPLLRDKTILQTAQADYALYPKAPPTILIEEEGGSSGIDSIKATIRYLAGFNARADKPTGPKEVRAEAFAAQAEAGNVRLVKNKERPWSHSEWIEELCLFPNGAFCDQVDATSGAYNRLTSRKQAGLWVLGVKRPQPSWAMVQDDDPKKVGAGIHGANGTNGTNGNGKH